MNDQSEGRLHPVESKYISAAAVVAFLLTLLLTGGSLTAAIGALALIAGLGWGGPSPATLAPRRMTARHSTA